MGETKDVHAILEMLTALQDLGVAGAVVMKDKKVDLADLPTLLGLVPKIGEITSAVKDAKDIPSEVADLSAEETGQIVAAVIAAFTAIKSA